MTIFDKIKKAIGGEKREKEAPEAPEQSVASKNSDKSVASGKEIVKAIDELLFAMRTSEKFPRLQAEDKASLAERFGNIQKVISGTHCENDVTELDGSLLSVIRNLEPHMAEGSMEDWEALLKRLNKAVKARIRNEYEIRSAALDMAELLLVNTNAAWQKQVEQMQKVLEGVTDSVERLQLQERIIGTMKNIEVNRQRLDWINSQRVTLEDARITPSREDIDIIDNMISQIRKETPEFVRIAQQNIEAVRRNTIESRVALTQMQEANNELQAVLDAAAAQAAAQSEKMASAAESIMESAAEPEEKKREAEAVAE